MKLKEEKWMRNPKGTYDYLPDEQLERNRVINLLKNTFENYGFDPIETPTLCMEDVLASKYAGGAEIMKEVYTLSDQGDRELGLRYDLTIGITFGVDVIMEVLRDKGEWTRKSTVDYLIIPMSGVENIIIDYSEKLRKMGINVDVDYSEKRVKKILNRANKLDIPYITVVGEDEMKSGKLRIKDMVTGIEKEFSVDQFKDIVNYINRNRLSQ